MNNKILVMGATGKIGSEVVKLLSKQKANIRAAIHQEKNAAKLANLGAEIVLLDINKPETIKAAFDGVKKLLLLLPSADFTSELAMANRIHEYITQSTIEYIVQISGMNAEHYNSYVAIHLEKLLNDGKIPHVHLRLNFFMQNFNTFYLPHINQKNLINIYDAGIPTSFIDVRDIAAVSTKFLLDNQYICQTHTLTGPCSLTHAEVATILSKVSGHSIKYTAKSDDDTRAAMRDCGWTENDIERYLLLIHGVQQRDFARVHTDVSDILERAPISFQQYAEDHKSFWQ